MTSHLVQILLPLSDNQGRSFPDELLQGIQKELSDAFGGLTAYMRAPAKGVWKSGKGESHDDIVVLEVMVEELDETWWMEFRVRTEAILGQEQLLVRAHEVKTL